MKVLFTEAGATCPDFPEGIINGQGLLESYNELQQDTFIDLGFKPEQVRVLKSLTFLLGQCSRLEGTDQNIAIVEHFFHPAKPTTETVADACEEVINMFLGCIEKK